MQARAEAHLQRWPLTARSATADCRTGSRSCHRERAIFLFRDDCRAAASAYVESNRYRNRVEQRASNSGWRHILRSIRIVAEQGLHAAATARAGIGGE